MSSSVIRDWTYDLPARRLVVTFVSGDVYAYRNVPPMLVEGLKIAPSKGSFFAARIRERYVFDRLHIAVPENAS